MRLVVDTFEFGSKHVPHGTRSRSRLSHPRGGSDPAQEPPFTLGTVWNMFRWDRPDSGGPLRAAAILLLQRHNDLFEELAKYRAARPDLVRDAGHFGAKNPRSWLLGSCADGGRQPEPRQQPEINIVRDDVQALARSSAGRSLSIRNAYDEAYQVPNEAAHASPSGHSRSCHEVGGKHGRSARRSYFLESLTTNWRRGVRILRSDPGARRGDPAIRKGSSNRRSRTPRIGISGRSRTRSG